MADLNSESLDPESVFFTTVPLASIKDIKMRAPPHPTEKEVKDRDV